MHIVDMSLGNLGANGIVGGGIPIAVGAALGIAIRGEDRVTAVFASDGAANNGVFSEGLNFAAAFDLPIVFVVENNQYAVSTPVEEATREPDLHKRGPAYGVESTCVDGNDVLLVYEHTREAVERCRAGSGPVLLEAKTYRHAGHHVNDPGHYMPQDKIEFYRSRDPCALGRKYLLELGGLGEEDVQEIETAVEAAMEHAVQFASKSPEPSLEEFSEDVKAYS
jgi:pyruvate dehydrogenase E1 component alpha subunit